MREAHVRHESAAKERRDAALGPIEELVRHQQVLRPISLFQGSDGTGRQDVLHAKRLEAKDVGAKIQLARQQPMTDAVACEKRHLLAAQRAGHIRRRRLAERCNYPLVAPILQFRHVVQAAAADDADRSHR